MPSRPRLALILASAASLACSKTSSSSAESEPELDPIGVNEAQKDPILARTLDPSPESFASLAEPKPGEWLAVHEEPGQTFAQWRDSGALMPTAARRTLYLLPLGEFPAERSPPLEAFTDYAEAYFQLPTKQLPALELAELDVRERINPNTDKRQLLTTDILDWMSERIPEDAYCVIAVTMTDLYPDPDWNFVFGEARLYARVGVYSFARHDPRFSGVIDPPDAAQRTLERSLATMTHEIGHMFGMQHCIYYECPMAGSNSLSESDKRPMHLCPVCLHKLHAAIGFDPVARYDALEAFYREWGIEEERAWTEARLGLIQGNLASE